MAKIIYLYFNPFDLTELLNKLIKIGVPLFDRQKQQIFELPFGVNGVTEIDLYGQENGHVLFSPCSYLGNNHLQCGSFSLTQENYVDDSIKLFSQIKRVVQKNFTYSKENAYYYGKGFYSEWLNKKYCLPTLLDFDKVTITNDRIDDIFNTLQNTCFRVKPNDVRLRDIEKVDSSALSFVIYANENQLVKTIIRKTLIHYEYDSACIFAYKDERKGVYDFILDIRLINDFPELKVLFEDLKEQADDY